MHTNIFSFGEQILLDFDTCDISNNMVQPMKLRYVFNKGFLVNHWRDIFNCSFKWLSFSNCYIAWPMTFVSLEILQLNR